MWACKLLGQIPSSGTKRLPIALHHLTKASSCHGYMKQVRWFGQPASQTHPHLLQQGEVTPGLTQDEYEHRRHTLISKILSRDDPTKDHLIIMPSASKVLMTHDIPYTFRQNTDFLYMCGFQEPDSVLVMECSGNSYKSTLFVPTRDAHKEMWEGPRSGVEGAVELTGVQNAYNNRELGKYLEYYRKDHNAFVTWYDYQKPPHVDFHLSYMMDFLKETKEGSLENPRKVFQSLRMIKSPAEIALMQKTCDVASKAFKEVMRYSHSGVNESHLYAKMDFECRVNGAEYLAYPPVVAGGNRANTIHYVANNQIIEDGEMVLMDAGCECHGYTSDISRTWPVSGKFSAAQRSVYEALLEVQMSCVSLCEQHDLTIDQIFREMLTLIGLQLGRLGILSKRLGAMELQRTAREFCPHHVGHYLGMDVHDTDEMSRSVRLQPGMVVTVEPGIYIPKTRVDVPAEYRGLGIRIEDDVLITETGAHNLSKACPKDPVEIEEIVQGLRS